MTEVTIKVPPNIKDIVGEIEEPLYLEALKEVAKRKFLEKRKTFKRMRKQAAKFEAKYSATFEEFSQKVPDTPEAHDDWIEWTYLHEAIKELQNTIEKLERLL